MGMHPEMKAEMAQEYHREMDNMREAEQETQHPPYDVVAVDADGEEMYVTDSAWTEAKAKEYLQKITERTGPAPGDVHHFTVKKR